MEEAREATGSTMLLYLDIDGVLNGHEAQPNGYCGIRPDCRDRLNRILDELPNLRIVLSSAWRYLVCEESMTLKGLGHLLSSHGIKLHLPGTLSGSRLIGVTCRDEHVPLTLERDPMVWRAWQIESNALSYDVWLAVDDLDVPLPKNRIYRTAGTVGLTDQDAEAIIRIFKEQANAVASALSGGEGRDA